MLFGDEKRFQKSYTASAQDKRVHAVKAKSTDEMVGPGSYFNTDLDQQRNGWVKRSFSRRQPMTPPASQRYSVFGRNDTFTTGVLTSYGALSAPMSPKDVLDSPGPGYYEKSVFRFPESPRLSPQNSNNGRPVTPRSAGGRPLSSAGSVGGLSTQSAISTTKRFLFDQAACLKDGVLFLSKENDRKETGPGYYSYNLDTLQKPSFNVRAKSPSPGGRSGPSLVFNGVTSPRSPASLSRNNSFNSVGSPRPRSASSGRLRNY